MRISADRVTYQQESGHLTAEGDVKALWNGATLYARIIRLVYPENRILADGGMVLTKDRDRFTGTRAVFDLLSGNGDISNADARFSVGSLAAQKGKETANEKDEQFLHVRGATLQRRSPVDYRIETARFTTCDAEKPSWEISASSLDVTLEEYATARNALFRIMDIPVFYFPYLIFPAKTERQSGFLIPRFGNSTQKGFTYTQPFYLALSPSADATLEFDFQSKRGVGLGTEFRYLRPRQSHGLWNGYALYDLDQERTRGTLRWQELDDIGSGVTLRSNVHLVTDKDFLRDFGEESGDYNRQYLDSTAAIDWRSEQGLLVLGSRFWRDLEASVPGEPVQRLPFGAGIYPKRRLGTLPLYAGIDGTLVRFDRDGGDDGVRVILKPTLAASHSLAPGMTLSGEAGYQLRGYHASQSDGTEKTPFLAIPQAAVSLAGGLEKQYDSVRHALFPSIGYRYIASRSQTDLPFFDWDDRTPGSQEVYWQLLNELYAVPSLSTAAAPQRELLRIRLSQSFTVSGSRRDLLAPADQGDRPGDIRLETRLTPVKALSFWTDSRYNPNRGSLSSHYLAVDYLDTHNRSARIGYYDIHDGISYLEGKVALPLQPLNLEYRARYSFDRPGLLESLYAVEYRHQCWGIGVSYRERPDLREFMVSFSLGGVGSMGKVKLF